MQSKPWSPGRVVPTMAFMLAPSQKTWPPASWTMRQISSMAGSKRPRVEGFVSISAATRGPSFSRAFASAPRSVLPSGFVGIETTS